MTILGIDPGYAIVGWGVLEYSGQPLLCQGLRSYHYAGRDGFPQAAGDDLSGYADRFAAVPPRCAVD